jgi:hypothetical protein
MTHVFKRYEPDSDCSDHERDDGFYVRAEDAINREAVNEAKIRTLEVQLKEAKAQLHRVRTHLMRKNKALVEIRNLLNSTFTYED